ncbi:4Fe-4S binding protein [Anoxybacterium hadale]
MNAESCTGCSVCKQVCRFDAINNYGRCIRRF